MYHNNILGTVLAGGKSQRFGEDKSQVKLSNKLLIDYVLSEIIDQFKEVLIVSNNSINFQNSEKITKIEDHEKGLGPLGGVLSAMKWVKANKRDYEWIATFPVDTPFFKKQILAFISHGEKLFDDIKFKIDNEWKSFKEILNKKNVSRKECLLLPLKTG